MTQQEKKPLAQVQQTRQGFLCGQRSVDLIDWGSRQDIDWQAEGQRVLAMLNESTGAGVKTRPNPHAA